MPSLYIHGYDPIAILLMLRIELRGSPVTERILSIDTVKKEPTLKPQHRMLAQMCELKPISSTAR